MTTKGRDPRAKRPGGYDVAARNVVTRIRDRLDSDGVTIDTLTLRVQGSGMYGDISPSTLRAVVTRAGRNVDAPTLNRLLLDAVANALRVPVSELATDTEYERLPEIPVRKSQRPNKDEWQGFAPGETVPEPYKTAERLKAFTAMYGFRDTRRFVVALNRHGYSGTESQYRALVRDKQHLITRELTFAASEVFTAQLPEPFNQMRLLYCNPNCPHCQPWLITA